MEKENNAVPRRILAVDDDRAVLSILDLYLSHAGFSVATAETPRQALIDMGLPEPEVEIGLAPTNTVTVVGSEAQQLLKLLDDLEENEDIEKVSSNFDISEADMEAYAT